MRKTKIVATLGPATSSLETVKDLIKAGLSAARINFSHGTHESHKKTIDTLKEARDSMGALIPLILDTKGPEIRTKQFEAESVTLNQGDSFTLTTEDVIGDERQVSITYQDLPKDVSVGSRILVDDGLIELKVLRIDGPRIECVALNSGSLSNNKGINVPDVYVNLPSLTEKDIDDIKFGIEQGFDYIAASFIRSANDVLNIRQVLSDNGGSHIMIISKIESREGVDNIDSILEVSDGIMVARGDLGVEIPPQEVPLIQKNLISKCNIKGKTVITATQMLESMIQNPRPTRAEANDVANAIFDGSDAVMLSGETAKGKYPVEAVKMMAQIAGAAEGAIDYNALLQQRRRDGFHANITNAIAYAACTTAVDLKSACIITVTDSGFTTRMVSTFRPSCDILAVTSDIITARQLNLTWGCVSTVMNEITGDDEVFDVAKNASVKAGLAKDGDSVVIVAGVPIGVASTTNTLKVQTVGDVITKGTGFNNRVVKGIANVVKVAEEAEKHFNHGDILVTTTTSNDMLPIIKRASAMVVGSWENVDNSHAETVAKALDLPLIICKTKPIDLISNGAPITVDPIKGFVYNGFKDIVR
ncbi:MAG: pyruvate kinase [Defluviitaleaceae bacterium]|nr:pyruvate kinase [Defluviitaleaceae bacterium]